VRNKTTKFKSKKKKKKKKKKNRRDLNLYLFFQFPSLTPSWTFPESRDDNSSNKENSSSFSFHPSFSSCSLKVVPPSSPACSNSSASSVLSPTGLGTNNSDVLFKRWTGRHEGFVDFRKEKSKFRLLGGSQKQKKFTTDYWAVVGKKSNVLYLYDHPTASSAMKVLDLEECEGLEVGIEGNKFGFQLVYKEHRKSKSYAFRVKSHAELTVWSNILQQIVHQRKHMIMDGKI